MLLAEGTTVLCDRYAFSGIAFSAAKGLPYEWCRAPETALPSPDLTLFLDIEPEQARARGGYGEERYEREEMQVRVRAVFGRIAAEMAQMGHRWVSIDAGKSKEEVQKAIWAEVQNVSLNTEEPVLKLWEDVLL